MDPIDVLLTTGEIAAAVAGFAAILLVLRGSRDLLSTEELLLVRTMVLNAVLKAFLVLPFAAFASGSEPNAELWRWLSVADFFLLGLSLCVVVVREPVLRNLTDPSALRLSLLGFVSTGLALLVQLANAIGWPLSPSFQAFFLGFWLPLLFAGFQFIFLIYRLLR